MLKNMLGRWLLQRVKECDASIDDAVINATADATPWRSGVNPDDVRFLNPESMTGAIRQHCLETRQPWPESLVQFSRCVVRVSRSLMGWSKSNRSFSAAIV